MLRFRNVFYTISKLFHCPAKVFSEQIVHKFAILYYESYTCILILLCLSIFRSGAISGLDWIGYGMGWDLCVGLLYEHRFAMLKTFLTLANFYENNCLIFLFFLFFLVF